MNTSTLQHALREWRHQIASPVPLSLLAAAAIVLTVMGPFQTDDALRMLPRFGYWLMIVCVTYSTGFLVSTVFAARFRATLSRPVFVALVGLCSGAAISLIVLVLNGLSLNYWPAPATLPVFLGNIFVIAFIVAFAFEITTQPAPRSLAPAPLLDRLPYDKRGPILALSVEDHYVNVHTSKGTDMLLMRLGDAIKEVGDTSGLQVHRSHWVATAAITRVTRKGDGAVITLTNTTQIPVSRSNIPALKEAGFLPVKHNG